MVFHEIERANIGNSRKAPEYHPQKENRRFIERGGETTIGKNRE